MIEEFSCYRDDKRIYGKLYLPSGCDYESLVILSHGLSLNHSIMESYAVRLMDVGIASYVFDFCGGGYDSMSDGRISDMSVLTEVDDLECVVDSLKSCGYAFNRLYLAGHSQGGLVSALVSAKRSDVSALFLFAPAFVIPDDVCESKPLREKNVLNLMPEYLGSKYICDAKSLDVYGDIGGYGGPVVIFHGRLDERVVLEYSVRACSVYDDCELVVFDDGEHRFSDEIKDCVVEMIRDKITSVSDSF